MLISWYLAVQLLQKTKTTRIVLLWNFIYIFSSIKMTWFSSIKNLNKIYFSNQFWRTKLWRHLFVNVVFSLCVFFLWKSFFFFILKSNIKYFPFVYFHQVNNMQLSKVDEHVFRMVWIEKMVKMFVENQIKQSFLLCFSLFYMVMPFL